MPSFLFVVRPGGASFETRLDSRTDTGDGFYRAHLHAARQAAGHKIASWVTRADTGEERYGFGPGAMFVPTTVLYQIMQMGLNSFWDQNTESWIPLPAEEEGVGLETSLEVV
jgi:hypothetical protein